jgi:predicted Fe-Mo cluster-binding NifX family protein
MKLAVVSDDGRTIAAHFGRAKGFIIYNIENNAVLGSEYKINNFTGHALGMADAGEANHHHGAILSALSDCNAVISGGMGPRIYQDLRNAGIEALLTSEGDAEGAVRLYLQGRLVNQTDLQCKHHKTP